MPGDERFTFRRYREGDEAAILDLFARSFHLPRSREHFAWKYIDNPYGSGHISLAFEGDRLVGHYAGYAVPFWYRGKRLISHQIGDTMTDPSVRNVGRGTSSVLARTALHFYENFCDGKVAFNYGFNTGNIQRFAVLFLRLQPLEPVHYRVVERVDPIGAIHRRLRGYRLELVESVGREYDDLFVRAAPSHQFLVCREAEYIRWRYLQFREPGYFVVAIRKWGRLVGWSAFRVRGESLLWGDALFDPAYPDAVEVLLRHVAPSYPVTRVEAWFPIRPQWFERTLSRIGFVVAAEPQNLAAMWVPFALPDDAPAMRQSFWYAMGDSDLF